MGHQSYSNSNEASDGKSTDWKYFVTSNIKELITMGQVINYKFSSDCIVEYIRLITDKIGGKGEFARVFGFPRTTVGVWYEGKHKPALDAILRICYVTNHQIKDIFNGYRPDEIKGVNGVFLQNFECSNRRKQFDREYTESRLRIVLKDTKKAPSMREIARNLKCNRKLLYRHFPKLCKAISQKHQLNLQACRKQRIEQGCLSVTEATHKLISQGIYPSRRRVEDILGFQLREKPLQETWRSIIKDQVWLM
ncbi:hypothetical protein ACPUYX_09860 [Desulfosporosinus sp. SYSU MS00001]|uniref:hypothetical protein n=1 Tax=Desulfosporosinus sp. SYSU MS00001 TaxID=3416284 RepID=UPI003CEAC850